MPDDTPKAIPSASPPADVSPVKEPPGPWSPVIPTPATLPPTATVAPVDPNARPAAPAAPTAPLAEDGVTDGPNGTLLVGYRLPSSGDDLADATLIRRTALTAGHDVIGAPERLGPDMWRIQIASPPVTYKEND